MEDRLVDVQLSGRFLKIPSLPRRSPRLDPVAWGGLLALAIAPGLAGEGIRLVDVAAESGLSIVLEAGRPGKDHLLDSAGAGVAWVDYDGDGDLDAYLVNGWKLEESRVVRRGRNALYRNEGNGRFIDVTDRAGVDGGGRWGSGVAAADVDGDGWIDLLVTNFGPNLLYRNRGDGTFEERAAESGLDVPGWNTGATFLDADADGDPDVYIARYIDCTMDEVLAARPTLDWQGVARVAMGPFGLPGARDVFLLNDGSGHFTDATATAGLEDRGEGFGFGVLSAELTGDDLVDIYVANDSDPNYLYRNEGDARFKEIGLWSGAALDANGAAQAGMGVALGDVQDDGFPDLVVTNFSEDFTTLYRGDGTGFFEDVSEISGVGPATFLSLSWGTALVDLDHDADVDLVIANGHIYPQVDEHPELGQTYRQRNQVLRNDGSGGFSDVTDEAGPGLRVLAASRGLAVGDFDDDGDPDLLISNLDEIPTLLRNDGAPGDWLQVLLLPAPGGRSILGARVRIPGDRVQTRVLLSGESFLSVHDRRLHFGLGEHPGALGALEVTWPGGSRVRWRGLPSDRRFLIRAAA